MRQTGPEALALVVGSGALGHGGLDARALAAAAMFSTAYLTDRHPDRTAAACFVAIAVAQLAGDPTAGDEDPPSWAATAERWARGAVPGSARATVDAALRHREDEQKAAEQAGAAGGHPHLAAGLVAAARARRSRAGA